MKISACIIAKNEEKNLPRLLGSLKGKFDEIILVDTGSTDRTKKIAKSYGCKVFEHEWNGFADARNRAVKEAKGNWLWHFDADFELEDLEFKKALYVMRKAPKDVEGFAIGVRNFGFNGEIESISSHIFIHRAGIEWEGKVHESPRVKKVLGIPVFVNHYGYADPDLLVRKGKRNLQLLLSEIKELTKGSKEYNFKLFYLVQTYGILSSQDKSCLSKAMKVAEEFLELVQDNFYDYGFFLVYMYNYYLRLLWNTGQKDKIESVLKHLFKLEVERPEFFFFAYRLYREKGDVVKAFKYILKTAKYLDLIYMNPFSLKWGVACECLPLFEKEIMLKPLLISDEEIEKLRREWKATKGRNLGLLLYWMEPNKAKKLKVLKKLSLRYGDNFVYKLLLKELEELNRFDMIEEISKKDIPASTLFKARLSDLKGKEQEAFQLYLSYLTKHPDPEIAKYFLVRFHKFLKSTGLLPIIENRKLQKEVSHGTED